MQHASMKIRPAGRGRLRVSMLCVAWRDRLTLRPIDGRWLVDDVAYADGRSPRDLLLAVLHRTPAMTCIRSITAIVLAAALLHVPTTSAAPSIDACRVTVFVNDDDPHGLNLRDGPGSDRPVRAVVVDADAMLDVTGSSGRWLRVAQVRAVDGNVVFRGEGWVHAPLTGVRARRGIVLHGQPDEGSATGATMAADDLGVVQRCRGGWIEVLQKGKPGWIAPGSHCDNSVTTCV